MGKAKNAKVSRAKAKAKAEVEVPEIVAPAVEEPVKVKGATAFVPRKYVCARWPYLRLRKGIHFDRGQYTALTQEMADIVEANDQFGGLIRRIFEPTVTSAPDPIERQVLETLRKKEPAVRRGAISSSSLSGQ